MKFAVSISGYGSSGSQPVTLLCSLDKATGVLAVGKAVKFKEKRIDGLALVTNLDLQERDFMFTPEHLRDAIRDYFARSGQGLIAISAELNRFLPDNKIERDGVDERGPRFQLNADIGNGEVAVLAAVAFVSAQSPITTAIDAMEDFTKLYQAFEI